MLEKLPKSAGRLLQGQRSGLSGLAMHQIHQLSAGSPIDVSSPAFHDHGSIPARYTADGEGLSPPLAWRGIPARATSLVLVVEDADAPAPEPFVHAMAIDLPPELTGLGEGALMPPGAQSMLPRERHAPIRASWLPPDPPPGHGMHRYAFQVFALDGGHFSPGNPDRDAVLDVLQRHAIARGCVIGTYESGD